MRAHELRFVVRELANGHCISRLRLIGKAFFSENVFAPSNEESSRRNHIFLFRARRSTRKEESEKEIIRDVTLRCNFLNCRCLLKNV